MYAPTERPPLPQGRHSRAEGGQASAGGGGGAAAVDARLLQGHQEALEGVYTPGLLLKGPVGRRCMDEWGLLVYCNYTCTCTCRFARCNIVC